MPKVKLNARKLDKLKPISAQTDYWDTVLPGLVVRVSVAGSKTFCVRYRIGRRSRRHTLGSYPSIGLADARDLARKALLDVARGGDPAQQKAEDRSAMMFEGLAAEYVSKYAKPRKRSAAEDERIIKSYLNPVIGKLRAKDVRRFDIRVLLGDVAAGRTGKRPAPIMSNRVLACVRKIYRWAIANDYLETSPCLMVQAPAEEHERDRVLSEDEIRGLWTSLESEDSDIRNIFKLRLLTAQRGGEVCSMAWADLDLTAGWWTIPAEKSKNGLAHRVPLSTPALKIVESHRAEAEASKSERRRSSPWVFPSPRGDGYLKDVHKAADRIRVASKILDLKPHDLRRTAASLMTGMGVSRLVVSKVLNHVESGITRVYDRHSYDLEKRQSLDMWGRRLLVIVSGLHEVQAVNT